MMKAQSFLFQNQIPVVIVQDNDLYMKTTIYVADTSYSFPVTDMKFARAFANDLVRKRYGVCNNIYNTST